jgi:hypothetical protein
MFDPNPVVTASNNTLRQPTATAAGGCALRHGIGDDRRTASDTTLGTWRCPAGALLDGPYAKIVNISARYPVPAEATASSFKYSSSDDVLAP